MEIENFSHDHPLMLCEERNNGDEKVSCYGCLLPISGAATYSCTQCKFILHKSCAELPMKIIHFMHPKHPLSLLPWSRGFDTCSDCGEKIWGFAYHCSNCAFYLHLKCALQHQILEYEGHEHSFMLRRPGFFNCHACGKGYNGKAYFCSTCQLRVHKGCASLPLTIEQRHDHPLNLTHTILVNEGNDVNCKICGKIVDKLCWGYCCDDCPYIAHLDCATSKHLTKDTSMQVVENNEPDPAFNILVPDEQIVGLIMKDVEKISLTENERVTELQHFSHQHTLTLGDDQPNNEDICDACVESISVPFYKCAQCNFFLHVSCAELPNTMLHPLHPHPLNLLAKEDGVFQCDACLIWSNGFTYYCSICKFSLNVKCTSLSETLKHGGHEHALNLVNKVSLSVCNACGYKCRAKFRCEECDFNLDLQCASLPYEVSYKWDIHPLKLTYFFVEHDSQGCYCDICEELVDINYWFYHCEDCDISAHLDCIPGMGWVKFGRTWKNLNHPHLLTLVQKTRQHPICGICGHPCEHWALECADCKFYIHVEGFCSQ